MENLDQTESSPNFTYFLGDQREQLTEALRSRLIECGWRDQVANMCRSLIQKHGVEHIRLEQIISEVGPNARQNVPEGVKAEMLDMIRKFDRNHTEIQQPQQEPQRQQSNRPPNDKQNNIPIIFEEEK